MHDEDLPARAREGPPDDDGPGNDPAPSAQGPSDGAPVSVDVGGAPAEEPTGSGSELAAPLVEATAPLLNVAAPLVRTARRRLGQARRGWRQRSAARRRYLRSIARQPLLNLFDAHPQARRAVPRELGLLTLDVTDIRGTAVDGAAQRGRDFLPLPPFRSKNWAGRWLRIRAAARRLETLPPIEVVKWDDDGYWVLDGHNRVAAALYEGQVAVDAVVVEYIVPGAASAPSEPREIAPLLEESALLRAAGQRPPATGDPDAPRPDEGAADGAQEAPLAEGGDSEAARPDESPSGATGAPGDGANR